MVDKLFKLITGDYAVSLPPKIEPGFWCQHILILALDFFQCIGHHMMPISCKATDITMPNYLFIVLNSDIMSANGSMDWQTSAWLDSGSMDLPTSAWLGLGSQSFGISELNSARARKEVKFTSWARLRLGGKWKYWAWPIRTHLDLIFTQPNQLWQFRPIFTHVH